MADELDRVIDNESQYGQDTVVIDVPVSPYQNTLLPLESGRGAIRFVFKKLSVEDTLLIEKLSYTTNLIDNKIDVSACDYHIYRKLLLRRCLLWFGDKEIRRNGGWVIKEDWDWILKTNAMILNAAIDGFEAESTLSGDDEKRIDRQASLLFGSEHNKITNPEPSISMYCTLASIWDKFGITVETLSKMSNADYMKIRAVLAKEAEMMKREAKKHG